MAASCSGAQCAACVDRRTANAILRALRAGKKRPMAGHRSYREDATLTRPWA